MSDPDKLKLLAELDHALAAIDTVPEDDLQGLLGLCEVTADEFASDLLTFLDEEQRVVVNALRSSSSMNSDMCARLARWDQLDQTHRRVLLRQAYDVVMAASAVPISQLSGPQVFSHLPEHQFPPDPSEEIRRVRGDDEQQRKESLEALASAYWKPIYAYLRKKGFDNEKAKDLTQGFLMDFLMTRQRILRFNPEMCHFRSFLLVALKNYTTSCAGKRRTSQWAEQWRIWGLDGSFEDETIEPEDEGTPEQAFHYSWACSLLDAVLKQVQIICELSGQDTHWHLFYEWLIKPALEGTHSPTLSELAKRHGVHSPEMVSGKIVIVRCTARRALREAISRETREPEKVDEEVERFLQVLSRPVRKLF